MLGHFLLLSKMDLFGVCDETSSQLHYGDTVALGAVPEVDQVGLRSQKVSS